jgi:hypothetical protein
LAQQGVPPGRPPREPGPGRRGREQPEDDSPDGADWPDSRSADWPQEATDAGPGTDAWSQPSVGRHNREARADRPERTDRSYRQGRTDRADRPDRTDRPDRHDGRYRRDRPERRDRADRPARPAGWSRGDAFGTSTDTDADLPPWAGPPIQTPRAAATRLRPPVRYEQDTDAERPDVWEGEERPDWPEEERPAPPQQTPPPTPQPRRRAGRRAAAARLRRSRRRVYRWCGVAIVACVIAAVVFAFVTHHNQTKLPYVTSLQRGEFTSVPDTCTAVSPAVLNQYLPDSGTKRDVVATQAQSTDSECSFTVDAKPSFLVLTVGAQSYQPFAAATGDGSASDNALDSFGAAQQTLAHPPKKSPLAPATITKLAGLGKQAFMAAATETVGHIKDSVVTVVVLDRNVIITVELSGQESGGYGPVSASMLDSGAEAAASSVLTKSLAEPTAS